MVFGSMLLKLAGNLQGHSAVPNLEGGTWLCAPLPQLHWKTPQIPSKTNHETLNGGTLGGAGWQLPVPNGCRMQRSRVPVYEVPSVFLVSHKDMGPI